MKRLVADTGPILHLHEAGALHLFSSIGEVLLAPLVVAELRVHAPALWPGHPPRWANAQTLSPVAQQRATEWQHAGLLQGGEAQALALALETKPDWFLTDDAGRAWWLNPSASKPTAPSASFSGRRQQDLSKSPKPKPC